MAATTTAHAQHVTPQRRAAAAATTTTRDAAVARATRDAGEQAVSLADAAVQAEPAAAAAAAALGDAAAEALARRAVEATAQRMLEELSFGAPPLPVARLNEDGGSTVGDQADGAQVVHSLLALPVKASCESSSNGGDGGGSGGGAPDDCEGLEGLAVAALSWSRTGRTLAAALAPRGAASGRRRGRRGAVAVWNLARPPAAGGDGLGSSRAAAAAQARPPDRLLRAEGGVTACAFHPAEPALLAGGLSSGGVVLWDLARGAGSGDGGGGGGGIDTDALVARSGALGEARHREPVVALVSRLRMQVPLAPGLTAFCKEKLLSSPPRLNTRPFPRLHTPPRAAQAWMPQAAETRRPGAGGGGAGGDAGKLLLLSLGADGRLLVWAPPGAGGAAQQLEPLMGYELRCPPPPGPFSSSSPAAGEESSSGLIVPGCTCLALADGGSGGCGSGGNAVAAAATAFVGCEGGALLRCLLRDAGGSAGGAKEFAAAAAAVAAAWQNPVRGAGHEPAPAPVTGASASPFAPSALLAASGDGRVRLLHALRRAPAAALFAPPGAGVPAGVEWSPTHPAVFAVPCCSRGGGGRGSGGLVLVYDLSSLLRAAAGGGGSGGRLPGASLLAPALTLGADDNAAAAARLGGGARAAAAVAAFNRAAPGLIAEAAGLEVRVWRLPSALARSGDAAADARALAGVVEGAAVGGD